MTLKNYQNIVSCTTEHSSQLFFVFTGIGGKLLLMSPLEFLQKTGLANRNFVIFKDPHLSGYQSGISPDIPDLKSLGQWQRRFIHDHPHIREVFCIGVSAGAIPAITTGHHLGVKTVWSFSARTPSKRWRARYLSSQTQKAAVKNWINSQLRSTATRLRKFTNRPARERFAQFMIDVQTIQNAAAVLSRHNGETEYRLFYSASNSADAYVHSLLADCPGVISFPVEPPPDFSNRFHTGWDHMLLPILNEQGKLGQLFPPDATV